ncbi:MAG TPA: molybdenum cofactor biosynthesis protein B [Abditibacteriaceae bacterium]|jgi:molybdenum cofactor biosynthesis protein B
MAQHPDHQAANQPLENVLPKLDAKAAGAGASTDASTQEASGSSSTAEHRAQAPQKVCCFVLTVSDTRTAENDSGGQTIKELLQGAGHQLVGSRIVVDEAIAIAEAVIQTVDGVDDPEVIIVTGGSGIGARDVTPEALRPLLTKEMPGFGEVFRVLSWDEVGAASMLSRAFAGVIGRTLLFALPGSPNAVRLAMEKIIVPELGHLVREVRPERREQ